MTTPVVDKLGDFFSVQLGPKLPVPVVNGVSGQTVTLANQDLLNSVTISRNNSVSGGAVIPPLGSVTVDMGKTIWGTAPANTLPLLVFPGGGQWAPSPAQVAAQINALGLAKDTSVNGVLANTAGITPAVAAQTTGATIATDVSNTGVPLLTKSTVLFNQSGTVVAAGGNLSSGQLTIGRPTYEIFVSAQGASSTEARPWISVTLTWVDSTSGKTVETQTYSMAQAFTGPNIYHGVGPIHADRVTVQVFNLGTTQNCTVGLLVLNNSLAQPELWRSESMITNAPNGFGGVANAYALPNNILFMNNVTPAGGATDGGRGIAFYCGIQMELRANTTSNTSDMELQVRVPASLMAGLGLPATANLNVLFDFNSDSKGLMQQTFFLPRIQCEILVINHNAGVQTLQTTLMGAI